MLTDYDVGLNPLASDEEELYSQDEIDESRERTGAGTFRSFGENARNRFDLWDNE